MSIYKAGRLPSYLQWYLTYASWFPREPHPIDDLVDQENNPYFSEAERLSAEELVLNSAGASTKRAMLEKVRSAIGIDRLLAEAKAQTEQEDGSTDSLAGALDSQENVQVTA
jgi:hypothetical protein